MELTVVKFFSVIINISALVTFYLAIADGINRTENINKKKYKTNFLIGFFGWALITTILIFNEFFKYQVGDSFPRFLIGLFVPVVIASILFSMKTIRQIVMNISLLKFAIGQTWRILGAIFFLIALSGIGPRAFIGSGIGDVLTGLLAFISVGLIIKGSKNYNISLWGLLVVGATDLLMVLYILLTNYPIWSAVEPTTKNVGAFPMMLIIAIAAPLALILHLLTLRKMVSSKSEINN